MWNVRVRRAIALAVAAAACLGGAWGCAMPGSPPDRLPAMFRMSPKPPLGVQPENAASASASTWPGNIVGPPAASTPPATAAKPAAAKPVANTASTPPRNSKSDAEAAWQTGWKYRTWSLFHRNRPTSPSTEPARGNALARMFPSLSGSKVDQAKLGRDARPKDDGDAGSTGSRRLDGSVVETTSASTQNAPTVLPVALRVQAFPTGRSPVLPEASTEIAEHDRGDADAARDESSPSDPPADRVASHPVDSAPVLASHESSTTMDSAFAPKIESIDALAADLKLEPGAIAPATIDTTIWGGEERKVEPASSTTQAVARNASTRQPLRTAQDPALAGRPRLSPDLTLPTTAAQAARPNSPARQPTAARNRGSVTVGDLVEASPRRSLFPGLTRLFRGPEPVAPQTSNNGGRPTAP